MLMLFIVLVTSLLLTGLEAAYRQDWGYWTTVAVAAPTIAVAQHGLYYLFHNSSSIMAASVLLAFSTAAMRTLVSVYVLEEGLDPTWITVSAALLVLAGIALKQG